MTPPEPPSTRSPNARPGIRWWPAVLVLVLTAGALVWIRTQDQLPFQKRNLQSLGAILITTGLLLVWWTIFSRARWRLRVTVLTLFIAVLGASAALFRITGVDGDLLPIIEPRWSRRPPLAPGGDASAGLTKSPDSNLPALIPPPRSTDVPTTASPVSGHPTAADFPQFLGPNRTAVLSGPALNADWPAHPPQVLWRQPIGAAWSGFAIVGNRAVTQEQRGEDETVTCYDLHTGRLLWTHSDDAHYQTTIAGEGPRCTPTVIGNRVYALGATGWLNCLDLVSGQSLWRRRITDDARSSMPEWGFSGSPLVQDGRVYISAGGKPDRSMIAYDAASGEMVWTGGGSSISHSSPFPATLAGRRQILMFNSRRITAHDPGTGTVLWEYPWGIGQPHVAVPIVTGTNRVVFSSGYGVGSELLEIDPGPTNRLTARRVWKSNRMKAKFSTLVARDGFLYGLDDGVMACLDLQEGALRWKEGRYGHGQGLLVDDLYLLMAEAGELVLMRPTPAGPGELGRFAVFSSKTWNPIALSGDLLLARNDREAACLRLPLRSP